MALVIDRLDRCAVDSFRRLNAFLWFAAVLVIGMSSCQRANAETIAATPSIETQPVSSFLKFQTSFAVSGCGQFDSASAARSCFCASSSAGLGCVGNYHTNTAWGGGASESYAISQNVPFSAPTSNGQYSNYIVHQQSTLFYAVMRVVAVTATSCPSTGGWTLSGSNCTRTTYSCPSTGGWTLSGTSCTRSDCPGDQTRDSSGACVCKPWGDTQYTWSSTYPAPLRQWPPPVVRCHNNCQYRGEPISGNTTTGEVFFSGGMTGSTCTTDTPTYDPPPGQTPPSDPPPTPDTPTNDELSCLQKGGTPGTVNGNPVCLPRGTPGNPSSDGSTTDHTTNSDGSTTTRTETPVTTCTSLGCTTTTTIVEYTCPPSGSPCTTKTTTRTEPGTGSGGGSGGTDPRDDPFCLANPSDPSCKRSAFAGSCGAFTCDGDAIQCAIASEQHIRNCEVLTDSGSLSRADAVTAFNTQSASFDKATLTTSTSLSSITGQTLYASTLADQTYMIKGQSITIPFSSLVQYLNYAGIAFMIVCGIVSVRIFSTVVT